MKRKTIRHFATPTLNFNASDYTALLDWNSVKLSPPPQLLNITNDDIKSFVQSGKVTNWDVTQFPFHTESVERCVKLASEVP